MRDQGQRFAFVRFFKGQNTGAIEAQLREVWIGSYHIFARVARFSSDGAMHRQFQTATVPDQVRNNGYSSQLHGQSRPVQFHASISSKENLHGNSYANVVMNKRAPVKQMICKEVLSIPDEMLIVEETYRLALLVEISKPRVIPNFKNLCRTEGFGEVGVRYEGGRWLMLQFNSEVSRHAFQVELRGLPLAVWSDKVVEMVISKWGELLFVEDANEFPLSSRRVCIAYTNRKSLKEALMVKVAGIRYSISVKELMDWEVDMEVEGLNQDDEESLEGSDGASHGEEQFDENEDDEFVEEIGDGRDCGFTRRSHHKGCGFEDDGDAVRGQGDRRSSPAARSGIPEPPAPAHHAAASASLPKEKALSSAAASHDTRKTVS
ncbi:hypothetical protein LXL04_031888 [Taraxacum kok-saghyz]